MRLYKECLFETSFIIFSLFCFTPVVKSLPVVSFQMPLIALCFVLLLLYTLLKRGQKVFGFLTLSFLVILFNYLFIYMQGDHSAMSLFNSIGANYSLFVTAFPLLLIYSRGFNYVNKKKLLDIICVFILITAITTIIGTFIYEGPCRELATPYNVELDNLYKLKNIGGYGFVYFLVLICPFFLKQLFDKFSFYRLVFLMICVLCVVRSEYTVAIILLFLELFISIALYKKNLLYGIIILIFTVVLYINLENILVWAIRSFSNSFTISSRLIMVLEYYKFGIISGDLLDRQELYQISLESFFQNPFWGGFFQYNKIHVGGHSEILDYLGHSGLFGVIILFFVVIGIRKIVILNMVKTNPFLREMYFIAFILALSNTFSTYELFYAILIIPVLLFGNDRLLTSNCIRENTVYSPGSLLR